MAVYIAEGYDLNLIIASKTKPKEEVKKPKMNGFWLFMTVRKEQLEQTGDDVIFDKEALLDKVAKEWDYLGLKKRNEFKALAKDKYPKQRKKILDDQDLEQIPEEEEESEYS